MTVFKKLICHSYIGKSTIPGARYGVFADRLMLPDDIIEECVIMRVPFDIEGRNVLDEYRIAWDDTSDVVATGCAQMYNHSIEQNARFEPDFENDRLIVRAIKGIGPGNEIFIRYACPIWWEEKK